MSNLPQGWVTAPIGELCSLKNGRAFKPSDWQSSGVPIVRIQNLNNASASYNYYQGKADERHRLKGGELLFAWSGTPGTSFGAHIWQGGEAVLNQHIFRVDFDGAALDKRFFRFAINEKLNDLIGVAQGGVGLRHVTKGVFESTSILVPPRAEQTRIADQLDTLLARVNACNDHLDAIPGILKRFRLAVIRTAMTGGLSDSSAEVLSQEWTTSTIGGVTVDLRYGTSKKCDYGAEGVGVLRIPNITSAGGVSQSDLKFAQFDEQETKKLALKSGDLLVIRSNGSLDLVGRCGLVSEKDEGLLFAGYLMRLRVNTDLVRPAFIMYWLMAADQRKRIELLAKSTSGVNNLNAEELRSLPLRFPTLPEQDEILRKVEAYMACADRIEARYIAMYAQTQRLAPQVLAKAFRGELTEQDPGDEPANALLSRLASKSATSSTEKVPRRPRQPRTTKAPAEASSMTKSRQDEDVKGLPYLAGHLRRLGVPTTAQSLFKEAELPVADFYKQLAWEIAEGHVRDNQTTLEPGNATG